MEIHPRTETGRQANPITIIVNVSYTRVLDSETHHATQTGITCARKAPVTSIHLFVSVKYINHAYVSIKFIVLQINK